MAGDLDREQTEVTVEYELDGPVSDEFYNDRISVETVWRGSDARRPDECIFTVERKKEKDGNVGDTFDLESKDFISSRWANAKVGVSWPTETRGKAYRHVGWVEKLNSKLTPEGVTYRLTSRVSKHRYEYPVIYAEYAEWDREANDIAKEDGEERFIRVSENLVFNPRIEGVRRPNMWKKTKINKHHGFFDPLLIPDEAYTDDDHAIWDLVDFWTFADIIEYLMWTCNAFESNVDNMRPGEVSLYIRSFPEGMPEITNFQINVGTFLPDALDQLLIPYNWRWFLNLDHVVDFGSDSPRIEITKTDYDSEIYAKEMNVKRAKADGSLVDPEKTKVWQWDLSADLAQRSFNIPIVIGDFFYLEVTLPLMPAWDPKYDTLTSLELEQLREDDEKAKEEPEIVRAWRDFVANEAADYSQIRTAGQGLIDPPDLEALFNANFTQKPGLDATRYTYPRKREMYPTIARVKDYGPRGLTEGSILVEYRLPSTFDHDNQSQDPDGGWRPISDLPGGTNVRPLRREIGVRFTSRQPVTELINHSGDLTKVELRITATIRSDVRAVDESRTFYFNGHTGPNPRAIFLKDRFRFRRIDSGSSYSGDVILGVLGNTIEDDTVEMAAYLEKSALEGIRQSITGPLILDGIDTDYDWIVSQIPEVEGMALKLNAYPSAVQKEAASLVVGVSYDVQQQTTTLFLDSASIFRGNI